jgi:N-methylhydantoinase B
MTNTLNTPVEALELEYPMRVERYELARGSGGVGAYRGGDGVVRAIRVLEDATVNLLTDRRRHAPPGLAGGEPGAPGQNLVEVRGEGDPPAARSRALPPKVALAVPAGTLVTVVTPGGGGWGRAGPRRRDDPDVSARRRE